MKEIENISLEKYLKMIGFDEEEISMILDYANSEIDKKVLHEKVKYLISLGLEARQIRIILEEDVTLSQISEWIKNYGIMLHHMHFHNNYKDEDSHSSLLKGSLDIEPIIKTLNEMQLNPQITFEIFDKDELFESVKYFDDIADKIKQG